MNFLKRSPLAQIALLVALTAAGWFAGRAAGPALARDHYDVRLAERIWLEDSEGLTERTLQSEAFRVGTRTKEDLFAAAESVRRSWRLGGGLFGLWVGLVGGLKIVTVLHRRRRTEYEARASACLACGRCFLSCPIEHKRLRLAGKE